MSTTGGRSPSDVCTPGKVDARGGAQHDCLQPGREQLSRRLGAQAHQSEMRAQLPRKAYEPLKLLRTNIVVVYGVCHLLCVCRRASCACRGTGERCEPKYEVMISCMKSRARNRVEKSCKPILEVVRTRFRAFFQTTRRKLGTPPAKLRAFKLLGGGCRTPQEISRTSRGGGRDPRRDLSAFRARGL